MPLSEYDATKAILDGTMTVEEATAGMPWYTADRVRDEVQYQRNRQATAEKVARGEGDGVRREVRWYEGRDGRPIARTRDSNRHYSAVIMPHPTWWRAKADMPRVGEKWLVENNGMSHKGTVQYVIPIRRLMSADVEEAWQEAGE